MSPESVSGSDQLSQSWPHIRAIFMSTDSAFRDLYLEAQIHAAGRSGIAGEYTLSHACKVLLVIGY